MKLNEKIIKIRVGLQNSKIQKNGKNIDFRTNKVKFKYFELEDILPKLNELMLEEKVNDILTFEDDYATLKLCFEDEVNEYKIPFIIFETPKSNKDNKTMQDIQYLGALNTYYKRYLYLNAFGITDGEVIDSLDNSEINSPKKTTTIKKNEVDDELKKVQDDLKNVIKEKGFDFKEVSKTHKITKDSTKTEIEQVITILESL